MTAQFPKLIQGPWESSFFDNFKKFLFVRIFFFKFSIKTL